MSNALTNALNAGVAAVNGLVARATEYWDNVDAEVAQHRAEYDDLASDLVGVVRDQMSFGGFVDPFAVAPDNQRGGVFASLAAMVAASPAGATLHVQLFAGADMTMREFIGGQFLNVENRHIIIDGATADPARIRCESHLNAAGSENNYDRLNLHFSGLLARDVEFVLGARADNSVPWSPLRGAPIRCANDSGVLDVRLHRMAISGSDDASLIAVAGVVATVSIADTSLDGAFSVIGGFAAGGVATIARRAVTISNGATLVDAGGALGTNYFVN